MAGSATIIGKQHYVLGIGHPQNEPLQEEEPAVGAGFAGGDPNWKQEVINGSLVTSKQVDPNRWVAVQSTSEMGTILAHSVTTGVGSFHLGGVHSISSGGEDVVFENGNSGAIWSPVWQGQSKDGTTLYPAAARVPSAQVIAEPNGAALNFGSCQYEVRVTATANTSFSKVEFIIGEAYKGRLQWQAYSWPKGLLISDVVIGDKTTTYTEGQRVTVQLGKLDLRAGSAVDVTIDKIDGSNPQTLVLARGGVTDNFAPYRKTWSRPFEDGLVAYAGNASDANGAILQTLVNTAYNNQSKLELSSKFDPCVKLTGGTGETNKAGKDSVRMWCDGNQSSLEYNQTNSNQWSRLFLKQDGSERVATFESDNTEVLRLAKVSFNAKTATGASNALVSRLKMDANSSQLSAPSGIASNVTLNDSSLNTQLNYISRFELTGTDTGLFSANRSNSFFQTNTLMGCKWGTATRMTVDASQSALLSPNGNTMFRSADDYAGAIVSGTTRFWMSSTNSGLTGTDGKDHVKIFSRSITVAVNDGSAYIGVDTTGPFATAAFRIVSDERLKTELQAIPDALLDVWDAHVKFGSYQLLKDGEDGKRHVGVYAQDIIAAFDAAGLDWTKWGIVVVNNLEGEPEHYSVSYNDVMAIEMALMRRKLKKLEGK